MLKNTKLSIKLYASFAIVVMITLIISFLNWLGISSINKLVINADEANWAIIKTLESRIGEKNFVITKNLAYLKESKTKVNEFGERINRFSGRIDNEADRKEALKLNEKMSQWSKAFERYVDQEKIKIQAEKEIVKTANIAVQEINQMHGMQNELLIKSIENNSPIDNIKMLQTQTSDSNELTKLILEMRMREKDYLLKGTKESFQELYILWDESVTLAEELKETVNSDNYKTKYKVIIASINNYLESFQKYFAANHQQTKLEHEMKTFSQELIDTAYEFQLINNKQKNSDIRFYNTLTAILALLGFCLGAIIAIVITQKITRKLNDTVQKLSDSASKILEASGMLSSSASQLAEANTEQAAAIEETSSSLEELAGMVDQNTSNASEATKLANNVTDISSKGNESIASLENSMNEILASNEDITNLVKLIENISAKTKVMDTIVFQTKLLSFNASVEAERAGEHGRGFAVVAQEVGSLASMSGNSAQEIAEIVENSINEAQTIISLNREKVLRGNELVKDAAKILKDIAKSASDVTNRSKQVLQASSEQSKGLKNINIAMTEIDKTTQNNAAISDRTANAGVQMASQVESLNMVVGSIQQIVEGGSRGLYSKESRAELVKGEKNPLSA